MSKVQAPLEKTTLADLFGAWSPESADHWKQRAATIAVMNPARVAALTAQMHTLAKTLRQATAAIVGPSGGCTIEEGRAIISTITPIVRNTEATRKAAEFVGNADIRRAAQDNLDSASSLVEAIYSRHPNLQNRA